MARYKPQEHNSLLLPVVVSEQIVQGYAAQAAVDSNHQVIIAADVTG